MGTKEEMEQRNFENDKRLAAEIAKKIAAEKEQDAKDKANSK
jgi:hypothetical protein